MTATGRSFECGQRRAVKFRDASIRLNSVRSNKWSKRVAGAALACTSIISSTSLSGPSAPVVSAVSADPGGEFHALSPARILDTRPETSVNDVQPLGAKPQVLSAVTTSAGEFDFSPLGKGGLPTDPDAVLAIVANFTVTQPGSKGWVAVYPKGFEFGGADGSGAISSLVNFQAGQSVPNLGIVGLDGNGDLTINAQGANTNYHLIIDVVGFISTSQYAGESVGARLEVIDPGRILDTRIDEAPIGPRQTRSLQVRGADTIADGSGAPLRSDIVPNRATVTAALVNLTLVNVYSASRSTHVTASPDPIQQGAVNPSSSNVVVGKIKANMAVVPIGADGKIQLFNNSGDLHLVADVLGYFEMGIHAESNRGRIVPLDAPFRAFDTREPEFGNAPLRHGSEEDWSFEAFVNSVTLNPGTESEVGGPPQQGVIGSLVAVDLQPLYPSHSGPQFISYLRVAPADRAAGEGSNVNFSLGDVVANMSLIRFGTKADDSHVVTAYNHYGSIDYLLDVYAVVLD